MADATTKKVLMTKNVYHEKTAETVVELKPKGRTVCLIGNANYETIVQ